MTSFWEKHRKKIFWLIVMIAFFMIYAYNLLTPYSSDDMFYMMDVRRADSLWDLVRQQYAEYISNSGRVVGQFNIRLSLAAGEGVFDIVNSVMFLFLVFVMYANLRRKKKYDIFALLLIITFLWKFAVSFGQTMLWLCGACNYLWGSVFILGFVAFYRHFLEKAEAVKKHALLAAGTFFFGLLAGWCNENTSGGGLLLILMFSLIFWLEKKAEGKRKIYPFMLTGVIGMFCGLLGMVTAPGVRSRNATMGSEEEYTGVVGMLSRTYKHTLTIRELFYVVLVILVIAVVLLILQKKLTTWKQIRTNETLIFLVAFLATCYSLVVMAAVPVDRAFFGAGIFLFVACIQAVIDVTPEEMTIKAAKYSLVSILCMCLMFTYLENLVNLARIYREENERIEIILREKETLEEGEVIVVPKYREAFENPYSMAHVTDLDEDPGYWINIFYENYYEVPAISAIPRDEWNELYGE